MSATDPAKPSRVAELLQEALAELRDEQSAFDAVKDGLLPERTPKRPMPSVLLALAEDEHPDDRFAQGQRFAELMIEHRYWHRARNYGQALVEAADRAERLADDRAERLDGPEPGSTS